MAADRRGIFRAAPDGRLFPVDRALYFKSHEEPDRRRIPDIRDVPDAVDHQLARRVVEPDDPRGAQLPLDHRALRRFRERHHRHETRHLLPQLHSFWTVPDGQVGRQRTVAWIAALW